MMIISLEQDAAYFRKAIQHCENNLKTPTRLPTSETDYSQLITDVRAALEVTERLIALAVSVKRKKGVTRLAHTIQPRKYPMSGTPEQLQASLEAQWDCRPSSASRRVLDLLQSLPIN